MRLLGTPVLDAGAYRIGIALAGVAGLATGLVLPALRRSPRLRNVAWAFVALAGAMVGSAMQVVLLARKPPLRTYILASGLTTEDAFSWALAGAPLGVLPALVAAGVVFLAFRAASADARPAGDDRERIMLPFAAACAVMASAANGFAENGELPVTLGMTLLAVAALAEIGVADALRARWLRRVFAGQDAAHEVVPVASFPSAMLLPRVVAGAPVGAVILRIEGEAGYRASARGPVAAASLTEQETLGPVRRRATALALTVVASGLVTALALALR
jgi:hypothetical protein